MLHRIALIVILLAGATSASAAPPSTLGYQGRLATAGGQAVSGSLSIAFRLYNTASGGSAVWSEVQPAVVVDGGNFAVELGQVTPLPGTIWGQQLFLGVQIAGDSEMLPRPPLTASPYALRAAATMQRTIVVSAPGTPAENGAALLAAVAQITDATAASPVAVEIDAGTFDLGTVGLQPPQFTTLIGRGQSATLIISSNNSNTGILAASATIFLSANSAVRDLTARNTGVPDGQSGSAVGIAAFDSTSFQVPISNIHLERVTGHSSGTPGSNGQRSGISVCASDSRIINVIGIGEGGLYANGMRADCPSARLVVDGAELYAFSATEGLRGAQLMGGTGSTWRRIRAFLDTSPPLLSVHGIRFFGTGSFGSEPHGILRDSEITIRGVDVATPTSTFRLEGIVTESGAQIEAIENVTVRIKRGRAWNVAGIRLRDPPGNYSYGIRLVDVDVNVQAVQDASLGGGAVVGVHVEGSPPELLRALAEVECLDDSPAECVGIRQTQLHAGTLLMDASSVSASHRNPVSPVAFSKAVELLGAAQIRNSSLLVRRSTSAIEGTIVLSLLTATANANITHSSLRATNAANSNADCLVLGPSGASGEWFGNHLQGVRCDGGQVNLTCAGNTSRGAGFLPSACP